MRKEDLDDIVKEIRSCRKEISDLIDRLDESIINREIEMYADAHGLDVHEAEYQILLSKVGCY